MSEPRFTNSSTSSKPAGTRKRPAKGKATKAQAEAAPPTSAPETPSPSSEAIAIRLSAIDREVMIQTAAYFRAERRNFAGGHELEDWLAAESEIDAALLSDSQPA